MKIIYEYSAEWGITMDNFYRAKRADNGNWVYGIYLPLLDGACMIPDDAAICAMQKNVDGVDIKGHLIETVPVERATVGLCTGVEDSEGMPVFGGDYVQFKMPLVKDGAAGSTVHSGNDVVLIEESAGGFKVASEGIYSINAVQFLDNLRASGNCFTVVGNVYDNPEFTPSAQHHIA